MMPTVGKKKFPYTKAGKKKAEEYKKKTKKKKTKKKTKKKVSKKAMKRARGTARMQAFADEMDCDEADEVINRAMANLKRIKARKENQ